MCVCVAVVHSVHFFPILVSDKCPDSQLMTTLSFFPFMNLPVSLGTLDDGVSVCFCGCADGRVISVCVSVAVLSVTWE